MIIKNIILKELLEVLQTMPPGTNMVRIEYDEDTHKIVIYGSKVDESDLEEEEDDLLHLGDDEDDDLPISPDEDLRDYV